MGKKFPPLDREQVESILKNAGFQIKRKKASHTQWEGYTKKQRRIVTVDHLEVKKKNMVPLFLEK